MIDRTGLADFLRRRRETLQPEDAGLPRGPRRRASGLRRAEVADLCGMSTDYYSRLERARGPQPSEGMTGSLARGLQLTHEQRDHLFRLAGHHPPGRGVESRQVSPGLSVVLDHLVDTPAEIITELGETLRQNPLGVALTGDRTSLTGPARSHIYRWFAAPGSRAFQAADDHPFLSRLYAANLRRIVTLRGRGSRAARLAELLLDESPEFRTLWRTHEVGVSLTDVKRFVHPEVGALELYCQALVDRERSHLLLVYTTSPGSATAEKLRVLSGLGEERAL